MRNITAIAVLASVALLAGCGGGERSSEDQVRETVRKLAEDAHASRWGDVCAASTKPDKCRDAALMLDALGVDASQYVPSPDLADKAKITVDGDHATVDATAGEDAEYVRRGDRWLFVWQEQR